MGSAIKRLAGFYLVWLVLTGAAGSGLLPGALVSAAAAFLSLKLLPSGRLRVKALRIAALAPTFAWRSIVGGADVAWRALHPRMPLRTGWLTYRTKLPPGPARVAFGSEVSLLPGSLVAGTRGDTLLVHCLDRDQDVAGQLAREERRIAAALDPGRESAR